MNNLDLNTCLSEGNVDQKGVFPHLDQLQETPFTFDIDFGLKVLPTEPGIISVRGARQYGKSTWLEASLKQTIIEFGPGTAFYLNGDFILELDKLEHEIERLLPSFASNAKVKRLFIDEITAIKNWEIAIKRLADRGLLKDVLLVTTGSSATDLRRGVERLPGRKGKLPRADFLFTPISYKEFHRVCYGALKKNILPAYLISGGSPIACSELAAHGHVPEYVVALTRDWIDGEIVKTGRSRIALNNIMNVLFRYGGTPVSQSKIAREAGLANNTLAVEYIAILNDLGVVTNAYPWDDDKKIKVLRKPCKYHFTNLLAVMTYHPNGLRIPENFAKLPATQQGVWYEWLVAQELMRLAAIKEQAILEPLAFWQNAKHELDFVLNDGSFLEVKRGKTSALEFSWFVKQFPQRKLSVVGGSAFDSEWVSGFLLEDFLSH